MQEWGGISTSPFRSSRSGWIGLQLQQTSTSFTYCSTIERRTFKRPGGNNLPCSPWNTPWLDTSHPCIHPVAMAGHSLGELTALCLAGVYSPEDGFGIVNKRALCMDKAAGMNVDPGVMAAVDAP